MWKRVQFCHVFQQRSHLSSSKLPNKPRGKNKTCRHSSIVLSLTPRWTEKFALPSDGSWLPTSQLEPQTEQASFCLWVLCGHIQNMITRGMTGHQERSCTSVLLIIQSCFVVLFNTRMHSMQQTQTTWKSHFHVLEVPLTSHHLQYYRSGNEEIRYFPAESSFLFFWLVQNHFQ